jgi:hypothetical protein
MGKAMRSIAARRIVTVAASCLFGATLTLTGASAAHAAGTAFPASSTISATATDVGAPVTTDTWPWE